jgi:hypothetical protein
MTGRPRPAVTLYSAGFLSRISSPLERAVYPAAGLMILEPFKYSIGGFILFGPGDLIEKWNPPIPFTGNSWNGFLQKKSRPAQ